MSLVNVYLKPERALVSVDSLLTVHFLGLKGGRNRYCRGGKLAVLPHQNAVIGCSGTVGFHQVLYAAAFEHTGDFDDLLQAFPDTLKWCFRRFVSLRWFFGLGFRGADVVDRQVVNLVGYSPRRQRVVGMAYEQETRREGFTASEIERHASCPWDASMGSLPEPINEARIQLLAEAQIQYQEQVDPSIRSGDQLLVATVQKGAVEVRRVADLGYPAGAEVFKEDSGVGAAALRAHRAYLISKE